MKKIHTAHQRNNMKKTFIIVLSAVLLLGCTTHTQYGKCIGLADDKNPALIYKVDAWNVFLGIVFFETIIVPLYVVIDNTFCPVDKKVIP